MALISFTLIGLMVGATAATAITDDQSISESMERVYYGLQFNSALNDRCPVYASVWELIRNGTGDGLPESVDQIVQQTSERIRESGKETKEYVPDEEGRGQFIALANAVDPIEVDPMVWLDMFYCINNWSELDERAREFTKALPDDSDDE